MLRNLVKFCAFLSLIIYPKKFSNKVFWLLDLFYTYRNKKEFLKCDGYLNRYIYHKGASFISIGFNSVIEKDTRLYAWEKFNQQIFNPQIIIGDNTLIGRGSHISCINKILIGNNVAIASRCLIIDNVHGNFNFAEFTFVQNDVIPDVFLQNAFTRNLYSRGPVVIQDNVHIGENCTIMPGVTIGHNSVVASNTIVTKSIKPYSLVSGNPAKSINFNI
jgi:acetyltransferase-like isoleucine patch superfamily enzyme